MTLFHYIFEYAKKNPNAIAFTDSKKNISYKELGIILLENQINIINQGVKREEVIGFRFMDPLKFVIAFLSYSFWGCSIIPFSKDISDEEMTSIIKRLDVKQMVYENTCCLDFDAKEGQIDFTEICFPKASHEILYHLTSGSTGEKKVCKRTLGALTAEGKNFKQAFLISHEDKILSAPPIWHSFSFGAGLCAALVSGATLILVDKFWQRKTFIMASEFDATILILVPTMARLISKTKYDEKFKKNKLRSVLLGTGNIDLETFETLKNDFNLNIAMNYGSTETGGIITRVTDDPFTSIGKPMNNTTVKIKDKNGEKLGHLETGELWVKSDSMMVNYFDNDGIFDEEGFFCTGDLACIDKKANIYINGRDKRVFKIGGKTISQVELENILKEHPKIEDCYVQLETLKDREVIGAWIVSSQELKESDVIQHCKKYLSKDKVPVRVHLCDEIPRNEVGKIDLIRFKNNIS